MVLSCVTSIYFFIFSIVPNNISSSTQPTNLLCIVFIDFEKICYQFIENTQKHVNDCSLILRI